jgi:hypothetical protein
MPVFTRHAVTASPANLGGLTVNACGNCGRQMYGVVGGNRWRRLMGHPWGHDEGAWWCVPCLTAAGYDVESVCRCSTAQSREAALALAPRVIPGSVEFLDEFGPLSV